MIKDIHILMGLPGSGKTTWAKKYVRDHTKEDDFNQTCNVIYYDLDENPDLDAMQQEVSSSYAATNVYEDYELIIDSLIHTNEQLLPLVALLEHILGPTYITVHYWRENRQQCLHNDRYRRPLSCEASIKHLPLDIPDEAVLEEIVIASHVEYYEVPVKPEWLLFSDKYKLGCTPYNCHIESAKWSQGGEACDCDDNCFKFDGDDEEEFHQFYELMANLEINLRKHPDIANLPYIDTTTQYQDYYGGYTTYAQHVCNVEVLYGLLKDKGLLPPL